MEVLVSTNARVGTSSIGRNKSFTLGYSWNQYPSCGMLKSRRFILGIGSKTKNLKNSRCFVFRRLRCGTISAMLKEESDKQSVGAGVLERDFEFKPSFSEYLKAMETVKNDKVRKQVHRSSRKNDDSRTPPSRRDDKNVKMRNFKEYPNEDMIRRAGNGTAVTQHEETVRGKFDRKGSLIGKSTQDQKGNGYISKDGSRGKYVSRAPASVRGGEHVKLHKLTGYSGEKMISRDLENQEFSGNGNGVTQRVEISRGKFDQKRSITGKSKDKFNSKEAHMDTKMKRYSRGETVAERHLHYQNEDVEPQLKDSDSNQGKKFQNARHSSLVLVDYKNNGSTIYSRGKLVHSRYSPEMMRTKGKRFEEEGCESNHESPGGGHVRNLIKVPKSTQEGIQQKSRKFTSRSKSLREEGDDDRWEEERAAFRTFEEGNDIMDKRRVSRIEMEERIQKLAKQLNGADINLPEWIFSKMMRSAQIRYSDHCVLRVIQILGKLGNWQRVLQVIEWLQMRERFKSHRLRYIYTTALYVLGKARRPVEALNVFLAMQQQMASYPDLVAYHSIAVTLGQAGHIKELFDVIDGMRSLPKKKFRTGTLERWDPRLEPDIVVYNAVLNACVKRKQWEGAFWVLQQLKQQGQKPYATTYGLVMEVMLACGKYNLVHEFFRKVQKSYIPNALAYKALVNALWKEGKTDEAVSAVEDMERRGIVGSAALYYDLARCLCSAGRCEEALMQIEKICKVANKPLVVTYSGLIQACLDSGNIQNAAYIFNQMKDFCSPNLVTCNIMLKAFVEHGLFDEAMKLFQKMAEDSNRLTREYKNKDLVLPDTYTFNTMLDACAAEKRWADLEHVYRRMLHHRLHFNAKRHLRIILDASRAGKLELLEITWEHLTRADRAHPPAPLVKEMFRHSLRKTDYVSALSCLTSLPLSDSPEFSKAAWLKLLKKNSLHLRQDTLLRLLQEASSVLTARNDLQNPVLQNLVLSCKDILRTQSPALAVDDLARLF